jgi:hypothetical protein
VARRRPVSRPGVGQLRHSFEATAMTTMNTVAHYLNPWERTAAGLNPATVA